MRVGKCYPGRAIAVFSSEAKDFYREAKSDEILFFPLETKKTTFLLKLWHENVNFFEGPLLPLPFRHSLLCIQAHIVYTGP